MLYCVGIKVIDWYELLVYWALLMFLVFFIITLSALIPPALIPPHFANEAVIRAGGRKGRRKKRPAEKGSGYRPQGDSKKYH